MVGALSTIDGAAVSREKPRNRPPADPATVMELTVRGWMATGMSAAEIHETIERFPRAYRTVRHRVAQYAGSPLEDPREGLES
jgi:hypothetical protein